MRVKTQRTCPACDKPALIKLGEICSPCRNELPKLRHLAAAAERVQGLRLFNVAEPRSSHAWVNWAGRYLVGRETGMTERLAEMVIALSPAAGPEHRNHGERESYLPKRRYDYGIHTTPVYMTKEAAAAVCTFRDSLEKELERAYEEGVERGRDLLRGLASGDVKPGDFDAAGKND